MLVFDLDGVLIDTKAANLAAYRAIGKEPPAHFYHVHWSEWCSQEEHDAKLREMPRFAHLYRWLPLMDVALLDPGTLVLSSISAAGLRTVKASHHGLRYNLERLNITTGLRAEEKLQRLISLRSISPPGVYFDDSEQFCRRVSEETDWTTCHVRGGTT